jgi:hypothetical protein
LVNPDFAEMLHALSAAGAEFLLVGAYAMAARGIPRATGDLDVWVRPTRQNAVRVLRALASFGAPLADLSEADLATPGTVFQLGLPPRRIDMLTAGKLPLVHLRRGDLLRDLPTPEPPLHRGHQRVTDPGQQRAK